MIAHNTAAEQPILNGSMSPPITIPVIAIARDAGIAIKAGLPATGKVHRNVDRPVMRDASFRSETIFHEYGHGVSLRLTGGPQVNCLTGDEQAGEGWSDFLALVFLMNPAMESPEGPRGYGQWALYADSRVGPGFRPRPYSRNMELQPFTYDSIKSQGWLDGTSLALPHGLGHGWASVLWDMAWDLVDKHGFNPNAYGVWNSGGNNRALQYVIDGLKFQGCGPDLVARARRDPRGRAGADRRLGHLHDLGRVRAPRPRLRRHGRAAWAATTARRRSTRTRSASAGSTG